MHPKSYLCDDLSSTDVSILGYIVVIVVTKSHQDSQIRIYKSGFTDQVSNEQTFSSQKIKSFFNTHQSEIELL